MGRIQIRSLLYFSFFVFASVYFIQYYYAQSDHEVKSRRGRFEELDNDDLTISEPTKETDLKCTNANGALQAFYYPWYGAPKIDGNWVHWNHQILPHWSAVESRKYLTGIKHQPPEDLGANYYPLLGPYSSKNISVIDQHLKWACDAGIGTFIVSYFSGDRTDDNGIPFQDVIKLLFQRALIYGIKIGFHLEPYQGRTASTVVEDIKVALRDFGSSSVYARDPIRSLPIFYIYDSYQIKPEEWRDALDKIRETEYDAYIVGLLVESTHLNSVVQAGFNAAYSYFASMNFSYGCTPHNWEYIFKTLAAKGMDFIPSVGPGYEDTAVRPWNRVHTKHRETGIYYAEYFQKAISLRPRFITVTSFNEWHEGTQIEPAVPFEAQNRIQNPVKYLEYSQGPFQYLQITKTYSKQYHPPIIINRDSGPRLP